MFWLLLIFAALLLVNARANYRHGKFAESGAGLAIAVCLCGLSWYVRRQEQQRRAFVSWLGENLESVVKGGHWYGDYRITAETELHQYEMAVSFLVATLRMESRYYFSEIESGTMASVLLTLRSLVLGWWGLPHGPFVTLESIAVNQRGGKRLRVQHLIDSLTGHKKELVRLTQRAADHARFLMRTRGFPATTATSDGDRSATRRDGLPEHVRRSTSEGWLGLLVRVQRGESYRAQADCGGSRWSVDRRRWRRIPLQTRSPAPIAARTLARALICGAPGTGAIAMVVRSIARFSVLSLTLAATLLASTLFALSQTPSGGGNPELPSRGHGRGSSKG